MARSASNARRGKAKSKGQEKVQSSSSSSSKEPRGRKRARSDASSSLQGNEAKAKAPPQLHPIPGLKKKGSESWPEYCERARVFLSTTSSPSSSPSSSPIPSSKEKSKQESSYEELDNQTKEQKKRERRKEKKKLNKEKKRLERSHKVLEQNLAILAEKESEKKGINTQGVVSQVGILSLPSSAPFALNLDLSKEEDSGERNEKLLDIGNDQEQEEQEEEEEEEDEKRERDPMKQPVFLPSLAYEDFEPEEEKSKVGQSIRALLSSRKKPRLSTTPTAEKASKREQSQEELLLEKDKDHTPIEKQLASAGTLARVAAPAETFISVEHLDPRKKQDAEPLEKIEYSNVPWLTGLQSHRYYVQPVLQLHNEIVRFCKYIQETPEEKQARLHDVATLRSLCEELFPESYVEVFGSFANDLCIPTSDVDMVLLGAPSNAIHTLAKHLRKRDMTQELEVISSARVPIIKLKLRGSKYQMDICFGIDSGIETGKMIRTLLGEMPALKPLVLVIKFFLQQRDLNETYRGGIGSHLCLCMVVSALQHFRKRLMCARERPSDRVEDLEDLGSLLLGFFNLYGNEFNYANVSISLRDGGSYLERTQDEVDMSRKPPLFYLENPEDTSQNLGSSSYNMHKIRKAFAHAHRVLVDRLTQLLHQRATVTNSVLSAILNMDDDQLKNRSIS